MENDSGSVKIYVDYGGTATKSATFTSSGGVLHGTWQSDNAVSTSDRRLKKNVQSVDDYVATMVGAAAEAGSDPAHASASWLLRELRPVSYNFKKGVEAKYTRFGFIADEVYKLLPEVVRELGPAPQEDGNDAEDSKTRNTVKDTSPLKGILYQDIIAILTSTVKEMSGQLAELKARVSSAEKELDDLDERDPLEDTVL